jgi:acetylornithine/N-succinyldiaminopimelate aminotransferase
LFPASNSLRFNDVADLRAKFSTDVCAILVEADPGRRRHPPALAGVLRRSSRDLTSSTGALLIADEIQAGLGRTGKWFAYQHYGIQPDVITLAKPIAGGLPLGAVLCTEEAARAIHAGMHGTTFGGGPLACAVAIAVIDQMEKPNLLAHATSSRRLLPVPAPLARRTSQRYRRRARQRPHACRRARLCRPRQEVVNQCSSGTSSSTAPATVLRFLPPYILERAHVDTAIAALDEILTEHAGAVSASQTAAPQEA